MRQNVRPLDALMPRTRQRVLATLLLSSRATWYRSDLARHLGVTPSSLTRELTTLTNAGLLRRRTEGRHTYYQVEVESPIYPELRSLLAKTAGLVDVLREEIFPRAGKAELAFVYGSIARGEEDSRSDVDLFVLSDRPLSAFATGLRSAESRLGRTINIALYAPADLRKRVSADHHFVRNVLSRDKLFVAGNEHELERFVAEGKRRTVRGGRSRD